MKKVRYTPTFTPHYFNKITPGCVYDVIRYEPGSSEANSFITILDDDNVRMEYFLYTYEGKVLFKDVTAELRNDIIDDILR